MQSVLTCAFFSSCYLLLGRQSLAKKPEKHLYSAACQQTASWVAPNEQNVSVIPENCQHIKGNMSDRCRHCEELTGLEQQGLTGGR